MRPGLGSKQISYLLCTQRTFWAILCGKEREGTKVKMESLSPSLLQPSFAAYRRTSESSAQVGSATGALKILVHACVVCLDTALPQASPQAPQAKELTQISRSTYGMQPKRLPAVLDALELREEQQTGGVYGIGT